MGNQQRSLEVRLSWLAGILDGEGTISFASKFSKSSRQKNYHFRPEVKVDNTDMVMIEEIISILDDVGAAYYVRDTSKSPSKRNPNWKPSKRVIIEGLKRLQKFLPIISPYLINKKPQADLLLAYIESRLNGPHKSPVTEEQEDIVLQVRKLNHRGLLNRPETIRRKPKGVKI